MCGLAIRRYWRSRFRRARRINSSGLSWGDSKHGPRLVPTSLVHKQYSVNVDIVFEIEKHSVTSRTYGINQRKHIRAARHQWTRYIIYAPDRRVPRKYIISYIGNCATMAGRSASPSFRPKFVSSTRQPFGTETKIIVFRSRRFVLFPFVFIIDDAFLIIPASIFLQNLLLALIT